MALTVNSRASFSNPGRFQGGSFPADGIGNRVKGGLRNRQLRFGPVFTSFGSGHIQPSAFILPTTAGALSSFTLSTSSISGLGDLTPAKNLEGSSSLTLTVTNAQLDQIVAMIANGTLQLVNTNAGLSAAVEAFANGTGTLSVTNAQLGGIFSINANGTLTITPNVNLTALAMMMAAAGGPEPLSPQGLANAVWDTILSDHLTPGTTGKALNDVSGGSSPETIATAVRTELTTELSRIDVATSTRLAAASYTAPDNSSIAAIKSKTDNLPVDPASNTQVNTRLAAASYTAPNNADISAIKAKTDNLPSDPADESSIQAAIAAIPAAPSAATVATAVWDKSKSGATAGSYGEAVNKTETNSNLIPAAL